MISDSVHFCFFTPLNFIRQKFGHGCRHSLLLCRNEQLLAIYTRPPLLFAPSQATGIVTEPKPVSRELYAFHAG